MDLNIDNYSVEELTDLLELEIVDRTTIIESCEHQIEKYANKPDIVKFYKEVELKLLNSLPSENVGRTFITEVKRGTINPDIKNLVTRVINIDSATRLLPNIVNYTSDNFICELEDPLLNVVSISLLSVEIPTSWYTISQDKGTNVFMFYAGIQAQEGVTGSYLNDNYPIIIPDGNYTIYSLLNTISDQVNTLIESIVNPVYESGDTGHINPIYPEFIYKYDDVNGRVTFILTNNIYFSITWYDKYNKFTELNNCTLNNNIGRLLGFITPISISIEIKTDYPGTNQHYYTLQPQGLVDISGTKYIMLSIKDYIQNRVNKNIIGMNTLPRLNPKMPSYYSLDIPQYSSSVANISVIPKSFMPQSKTTTINSINEVIVKSKISYADSSNIFAKIPVKRTDWAKNVVGVTGQYQSVLDCGPVRLMVDMSGPLQLNIREYFGPVTLSALEFTLYDDKGHILGLNGSDWSCSLLVKSIYQY